MSISWRHLLLRFGIASSSIFTLPDRLFLGEREFTKLFELLDLQSPSPSVFSVLLFLDEPEFRGFFQILDLECHS